jgi:K+-sensing histidine kinase KdpD
MLAGAKMEHSKKFDPEVSAQLRKLAHDLSNSIETVIQASYLLNQRKLDAQSKKWARMIETAADEAAHINRGIRELLRSHSSRSQTAPEKAMPKRRVS